MLIYWWGSGHSVPQIWHPGMLNILSRKKSRKTNKQEGPSDKPTPHSFLKAGNEFPMWKILFSIPGGMNILSTETGIWGQKKKKKSMWTNLVNLTFIFLVTSLPLTTLSTNPFVLPNSLQMYRLVDKMYKSFLLWSLLWVFSFLWSLLCIWTILIKYACCFLLVCACQFTF